MALAEFTRLHQAKFGTDPVYTKFTPWFNYVNFTLVSTPTVAASFEIKNVPAAGLLLSTPGTYKLLSDIYWGNSNPMITIKGVGITLDLNGKSIDCCNKSVAIKIEDSVNVLVQNGIIKNCLMHHVHVKSSVDVTLNKLRIKEIKNCDKSLTPAAIFVQECFNVRVDNTTIKQIKSVGTSVFAVQFVGTVGAFVTNSTFSCIRNGAGATVAVGQILCSGVQVVNVHVSDMRSGFIQNKAAVGHTCVAVLPTLCDAILVENCEISNVHGSCDDAHGISIFVCADSLVKRCKVKCVSTGKIGCTSAKTTGIEIYASIAEVTDCKVRNITAINPGDKQCTGFSTALSNDVLFNNCTVCYVRVFNVKGETSNKAGYGTGFGWAPDPRAQFIGAANKIVYRNCTARNCQIGFDTWYHTNSLWDNIYSCNNIVDVKQEPNEKRTFTCNTCSECNLTTTLTNIATNNTVVGLHKSC